MYSKDNDVIFLSLCRYSFWVGSVQKLVVSFVSIIGLSKRDIAFLKIATEKVSFLDF